LIKKHNPHYNISLKDGKSYPLIRITNEPYPKVFKTRRIIKDGSEYFGPYPDGASLAQYLNLIDRLFPLRKCGIPLKKRYSPCLYYHIGRCCAPCIPLVSQEEYRKHIDKIRAFLQGKSDELINQVKEEMLKASKEQDYEHAIEKRDLLIALENVTKSQQVQDFAVESRDYAACVMRMHLATVSIMQMRDGKLMGKALYRAETFGDETDTLLNFLIQYYSEGANMPQHIYISHDVDVEMVRTYFEEHMKGKIEVEVPMEGRHYRILRMAMENASRDVEKRLKTKENPEALEELQTVLDLEELPKRIEGFDIAQLSGKFTVASLIVFIDAVASPGQYRRFNIKSLEGRIDDYKAITEAVTRRYTRQLNEKQPLPDLILIDGGKGQVDCAKEALIALGIDDIPVIGLAKEFEEIHFPDERPALRLSEDSVALKLLQSVRDETHRFATSLNQLQRSKEATFALLESIDGIGSTRSRRLMQAFGTLDALLSAFPQQIAEQAKVPVAIAEKLLKTLRL
ncbi:MAG: excinuclease ABC subunit UvrC, partial [Sphaerochaetaceae bacterium]|nr:excinuclease ABC subunit UvrC [Sphaerochaetaceae bacterium]